MGVKAVQEADSRTQVRATAWGRTLASRCRAVHGNTALHPCSGVLPPAQESQLRSRPDRKHRCPVPAAVGGDGMHCGCRWYIPTGGMHSRLKSPELRGGLELNWACSTTLSVLSGQRSWENRVMMMHGPRLPLAETAAWLSAWSYSDDQHLDAAEKSTEPVQAEQG